MMHGGTCIAAAVAIPVFTFYLFTQKQPVKSHSLPITSTSNAMNISALPLTSIFSISDALFNPSTASQAAAVAPMTPAVHTLIPTSSFPLPNSSPATSPSLILPSSTSSRPYRSWTLILFGTALGFILCYAFFHRFYIWRAIKLKLKCQNPEQGTGGDSVKSIAAHNHSIEFILTQAILQKRWNDVEALLCSPSSLSCSSSKSHLVLSFLLSSLTYYFSLPTTTEMECEQFLRIILSLPEWCKVDEEQEGEDKGEEEGEEKLEMRQLEGREKEEEKQEEKEEEGREGQPIIRRISASLTQPELISFTSSSSSNSSSSQSSPLPLPHFSFPSSSHISPFTRILLSDWSRITSSVGVRMIQELLRRNARIDRQNVSMLYSLVYHERDDGKGEEEGTVSGDVSGWKDEEERGECSCACRKLQLNARQRRVLDKFSELMRWYELNRKQIEDLSINPTTTQ